MTNVKAYIREDYIKKNGTCAVNCYIYIGREKVRIPVGINVKPEHWNKEEEKVKGNSTEAKDYNLIINNVKAKISDIFVKYRLEKKRLTKKILIKEFNDNSSYENFWEFMEFELNRRKGTIADNTYKGQFSTLKKFKEALPGLPLYEMNEDAIIDLKKILQKKYGNSLNTVSKNLITLKTYTSIALRKKLIDRNPFEVEKIKRYKSNQIWLTEPELNKFVDAYKHKSLATNYHKILDYFLFACFTGMRMSDIKIFTMEQIKGEFILINPVKTKRTNNEIVAIPITKPIRYILNRVTKYRVHGKIFETYADAVTNRMLKKIASMLDINKEISFHSARHTFATYFLEKTDDLATLQKLLGHSDIKQTMVYVHLTEKKKVVQMNKCWNSII